MVSTLGLGMGLLLATLTPGRVPLQAHADVAAPAAERLYTPGLLAASTASASSHAGARSAYTPLSVVTGASLLVTGALGTLVALNQGTVFHPGLCEEAGTTPIFGRTYGCRPLSIVHGASAVLSVALFAATTAVGALAGEPPFGHGRERSMLHRVLSWVALVGLAIQPLLGLVSAYPEIVGVQGSGYQDFRRVGRTVHLGIGYVTIASYLTTVVLQF